MVTPNASVKVFKIAVLKTLLLVTWCVFLDPVPDI